MEKLLSKLNSPDLHERLATLGELVKKRPALSVGDVNNHIHTWYSFSPYSPSRRFMAYAAGLDTAGIMDHDSLSGAEEFLRAGRLPAWRRPAGWSCARA